MFVPFFVRCSPRQSNNMESGWTCGVDIWCGNGVGKRNSLNGRNHNKAKSPREDYQVTTIPPTSPPATASQPHKKRIFIARKHEVEERKTNLHSGVNETDVGGARKNEHQKKVLRCINQLARRSRCCWRRLSARFVFPLAIHLMLRSTSPGE